jgi:hypothetical protein
MTGGITEGGEAMTFRELRARVAEANHRLTSEGSSPSFGYASGVDRTPGCW